MENIVVTQTPKTPSIKADILSGKIEITGRSNPENAAEFYRPLISWLDNYLEHHTGTAIFEIDLEHFNTSSSKCIMDVFKRLQKLSRANRIQAITWYYESDDEEMLEAAETYEAMTGLDFKKIPKPVNDL